jgi:hypothetical protein
MTTEAGRPDVDDPGLIGEATGSTDPSRLAAALCPYLATPSGHWRSALPTREHRCTAVAPPVPLALDKQRRLCLALAHTTCATYLAANLARSATLPAGTAIGSIRAGSRRRGAGAGHRPLARTTPILLERPRVSSPISEAAGRAGGQIVLVALLILAFAAIVLARFGSAGAAPPSAPVSAAPATVLALPTTAESALPIPSTSPDGSPAGNGSPAVSGGPGASSAAGQTYIVQRGDTLSSIAQKFGVSASALQKANRIKNPSLIRPGQVLKIP